MARQGGLGKGLQEVLANVPPAPDPTDAPDGVVVGWGSADDDRSQVVPSEKKKGEERKKHKAKAKGKAMKHKDKKRAKGKVKKKHVEKKAEKGQVSG
jgi:hypothetical protein